MREARVRPTLVTLNALASAHASVGDMDATERILGQATTAFRFSLDHYSFAALFQAARRVAINTHPAELARNLPGTCPQACANDEDGAGAGRGGRRERQQRARRYVLQMWSSGVAMTERLAITCRRALGGTHALRQLRAEYDASRAKASAAVTARQRQPGLSDGPRFRRDAHSLAGAIAPSVRPREWRRGAGAIPAVHLYGHHRGGRGRGRGREWR